MSYILLSDNNYEYISSDYCISLHPFPRDVDCIVLDNGQVKGGKYWTGDYIVEHVTGYIFAIYIILDIIDKSTITVTLNNKTVFKKEFNNPCMQRFKYKIPVFKSVNDVSVIVTNDNMNEYTQSKIKISGYLENER